MDPSLRARIRPKFSTTTTTDTIVASVIMMSSMNKYSIGWYHLLRPVLAEFVAAFDSPTTEENKTFWGKVCHRKGGGSDPTYLGGWMTAICVFDK